MNVQQGLTLVSGGTGRACRDSEGYRKTADKAVQYKEAITECKMCSNTFILHVGPDGLVCSYELLSHRNVYIRIPH